MARVDIELCSPFRHSHFHYHGLDHGLTPDPFGGLRFSRHSGLVCQFGLDDSDRLPGLLVFVLSKPVHKTLTGSATESPTLPMSFARSLFRSVELIKNRSPGNPNASDYKSIVEEHQISRFADLKRAK
jgi:hypothetical protein